MREENQRKDRARVAAELENLPLRSQISVLDRELERLRDAPDSDLQGTMQLREMLRELREEFPEDG